MYVMYVPQECIAQGVGNFVCGLFGAMGGDAMIGQSTINVMNGARARLSGVTAALGMLVAILATLVHQDIVGYRLIVVGVVIGAGIGAVLALKIQMTDMPQMVALLNGFGGGASVLVAGAEMATHSPLLLQPPSPGSHGPQALQKSGCPGS